MNPFNRLFSYFSTSINPPQIFLDPEEAKRQHTKRVYRHHMFDIPILRAFGMLIIALFVLLHNLYLAPTATAWVDFWSLLGIYAVYIAISWAMLLVYFSKVHHFNLGFFFLFFDIIFFIMAIYYSGGEKSWLFFLLMVRTADQARTTWGKTLLFANASTLGYVLMLVYLASVQHRSLSVPAELTVIFFIYASNIYLSFVSKTADDLRNRMTAAIRVSRDLIRQMETQSSVLKASEGEYRALVEGSIQGIVIHQQGIIQLANASLARIFGYEKPEALIGLDYMTLVAHQERDRLEGYQDAFSEGLSAPECYEFLGVRKDRTSVWIECLVSPITWRGEPAILATLQDITARRQAEEELQRAHAKLEDRVQERTVALQQANQALFNEMAERRRMEEEKERLDQQFRQSQKMEAVGQLAGGVAHDFNNMLGVILGHTEMAMEHVDPAQPLFADLEEIRKAASRSADLTRQLLAFARKQTVAPQVLDLNETIDRLLKMLQRLIGEAIDLTWIPGAGIWPVKIDPSQIDQMLTNLCVNARDAIAGVGRITVETGNDTLDDHRCAAHAGLVAGEYVRISVSDTGCGVDQPTLAHIFEPFLTTKAIGSGTGLGLATVYGAVKQNNGFIDVDSEPGRGTVFTIYLPRHKDVETSLQTGKKGAAEPVVGGHETILLVEDEPTILKMTTIMLQRLGYTVLAAGTPGEAIRLVRDFPGEIHLLMTDVIMPKMNGRDLAKQLLLGRKETRCLFMSGYTSDIIANQGVLDEGVHFIQKPFCKTEVAAKIREVLKTGRLTA